MHGIVRAAKMMANIVDLGMTVVAASDTVIGTGGQDLVEFNLAVFPAFFGVPRLQESAAATAAVIIRLVWRHFDDIFFADHCFDDKTKIIGHRIAKALADNLTGILDGEGDS